MSCSKVSLVLSSIEEPSHDVQEAKKVDTHALQEKIDKSNFFWRSKELAMLREAQQQAVAGSSDDDDLTTCRLPAAVIWGVSGTGKSHLIQQFLSETQSQSACYVLQGKYDENNGINDPFSAIVQALNDFSSQLESGPLEELERIRASVKAAFGDEADENANENANDPAHPNVDHDHDYQEGRDKNSVLAALITVVPSISILLDNYHGTNAASDTSSVHSITDKSFSQHSRLPTSSWGVTESAWNRLQYTFLHLVKAISTKERPVYLFLDDLQWSSPVALELLSSLVCDPELKNFLFLGSIRQETNPHNDEVLEVATNSALHASFLSRLQSQPKELTQVTIENLSLEDTEHFLSNLLSTQLLDDNLNNLATKIHSKTRGNMFFTIQALEELQRNGVLVYNHISSQWEWNFETWLRGDISISDNVLGAIESKLKQLPQDLQQVLSIAAYVRATFDVATLLHVVQNEQRCAGASSMFTNTTEVVTAKYLTALLEKAVMQQLLSNPIGGRKYRFTHDRIQQAAQGIIPHGEVRDMLRLRIGHCLLKLCRGQPQHEDRAFSTGGDATAPSKQKTHHHGHHNFLTEDDRGLLFVAADHLNGVTTKDHMFSVMLNLEVGERAIQMAALSSAAAYLQKAADRLKRVRNPWEEHYDICLRLYRARSDVELSLGHFQLGYGFGEEVLKRSKTLPEKLPTYLSMARGLGREDEHTKSLDICLLATTQLKVYPQKWYLAHAARGTMKIKSFLKKNDNDTIVRSPCILDEGKLISMRLLTELAIRAFLSQNIVKWVVAMCKQLQHAIRFGLCEDSAVAFASFGLLLGATGDQDTAMRCAGLAQRILSKSKGKALAGWACLITATYIIPFRSSAAEVIREHRKGYVRSMEAGEFEIGFLNWQMCAVMAYIAGYELQYLLRATVTTLQQSETYGTKSLGDTAAEFLLMLQMMVGEKTIDWDEIEECAKRDLQRENLDSAKLGEVGFQFYHRMVLATYFRNFKLAKTLADSYRYATSQDKSCLATVSRGLFPGIIAAGRYRDTGKRKHIRTLNKMVAELNSLAKDKGPMFVHHVLLLKAELESIQKHKKHSSSVKQAYDLAIAVASTASYAQDAALACELAGEHCVRADCSKAETSAYFVKAVDFYQEWGCVIKVDDIKKRHPEYLEGLDDERRVGVRVRDVGIVSNMFGNTAASRRAQVDLLSSYTPSRPTMGASLADSATKMSHAVQESIEEDCDMSVLTHGS